LARPSYRIGIGIGSGGVHPSIGVGLGGLGGYGTVRRRRDPWAHREDPYLRREQEVTDQAKTEALEQALEQRSGLESGGNAPLLTNSQPLPQEQISPGAPDSWRAGASSVASATGSGEVKEVRPEAYRRPKPAIGSTWNPAGPPLATSPAPSKGGAWPVVVQPKITPSVKAKQQASDRAKTEELEKQLDQQGVEGSPVGSPSGEFRVLAASPSSSSGKPSFGGQESELAVLRARNKALEQELEMLKKSISGSQ
jgi:MYXO-CTERM domain-containing protein